MSGVPEQPVEAASEPGGDPQAALRARLVEDAGARARYALEDPLFPQVGPRCPRCGKRLTSNGQGGVTEATCPRCGVVPTSADAGTLLVPTGGVVGELFRGMSYLPRGLLRVVRSPRLWKFAAVPFLINLLVIGGTWFLAREYLATYLGDVSDAWEKNGWGWWALSFGVDALEFLAKWLTPLVVSFLIVAPPFSILYKLLFMPFMELMTEATERIVLGFEDSEPFDLGSFYGNLVVAIVDAVLLSLLQALLLILLLPVNFVPAIGSIVWSIVPPSLFAGMDYSDINLVRRGYTTSEKIRLWRTYQWRFFGYGMSFFFLITLPLVNFVVIPAAAAGGALLYLELERK